MSFTKHLAVVLSGALSLALPAKAETELTMYYPIAVGGSLTTVVDGIVAGFEAANPDIKVNAIYSGNYDDTRVRALSALNSGEPAQLAVMFSIDAYDLIEQDLVVPFDDVVSSDAAPEYYEEIDESLRSPEQALEHSELIESLAGSIEQLPERTQQILALYYQEEMNLKEIGAILDVSESRVSQILSETAGKLRVLMSR